MVNAPHLFEKCAYLCTDDCLLNVIKLAWARPQGFQSDVFSAQESWLSTVFWQSKTWRKPLGSCAKFLS